MPKITLDFPRDLANTICFLHINTLEQTQSNYSLMPLGIAEIAAVLRKKTFSSGEKSPLAAFTRLGHKREKTHEKSADFSIENGGFVASRVDQINKHLSYKLGIGR